MTDRRYKPDGYRSVQPYLIVTGAARLAAFAVAAFDAEILEQHLAPSGTVQHGALRIGDSVIEFADGNAQWPIAPASLHMYVPDCDAVFAKAVAAGGTVVYEVTDHDYGERSGGVKDPCGNSWFIATLTP
jgi:PhnB protein